MVSEWMETAASWCPAEETHSSLIWHTAIVTLFPTVSLISSGFQSKTPRQETAEASRTLPATATATVSFFRTAAPHDDDDGRLKRTRRRLTRAYTSLVLSPWSREDVVVGESSRRRCMCLLQLTKGHRDVRTARRRIDQRPIYEGHRRIRGACDHGASGYS